MEKWYVYLGGPISGLSYENATDWREYVAKKLPPEITAISPLRAKKYLAEESQLKDFYNTNSLSAEAGITCRDRFDVTRAHALLFNLLGADTVSIGSVMEIAWGDMLRKPIVIAMEWGGVHDHAMIRRSAGFIVPTLDQAIEVVKAVLLPT